MRGRGLEGGGWREEGGGTCTADMSTSCAASLKMKTFFWFIAQNQCVFEVRGRTFFMSGFTSPLARRSAADAAETVRMLG